MSIRGHNFAVCCTVEVSRRGLDAFLKRTYEYATEMGGSAVLTVVEDINIRYDSVTQPPTADSSPGSAPVPSPFLGVDARECARKLKAHVQETSSDINPEHFLILDERFLKDGSVLYNVGPIEKTTVTSVRLESKIANLVVQARSVGAGHIDEDIEIASTKPDGVIRF